MYRRVNNPAAAPYARDEPEVEEVDEVPRPRRTDLDRKANSFAANFSGFKWEKSEF